MSTEEITPEDWEHTGRVIRYWKHKMRSFGTILDDEIESAGLFGLTIALKEWEPKFLSWSGYLDTRLKNSITDTLRKWTHKKRDHRLYRKLGFKNPYEWPKGIWIEEDGEMVIEAWDNESDFHKLETKQMVISAMKKLSKQGKQVIHQYFWEGKIYKDIGTDMGVHHSRIGHIMNQAKDKLRESLAESQFEDGQIVTSSITVRNSKEKLTCC